MLLAVSNGNRAIQATAATFLPTGTTFTEPLPVGTIVGTVIVSPPTWVGIISVDTPFEMSGNVVIVGGDTPLDADTYPVAGSVFP
jgi:hypothetical protein